MPSTGRPRPRGPEIAAAVLLLLLAGCPEVRPVFPSSAGGYSKAGEEARYGPEDLHAYIDGAAEVYRAFGVREARAARYGKPGSAEIVADLFDMGSAEGAFGAFHHDVREGEPAGIGRESERSGASLAFWKGRFFASLFSEEETAAAAEAVAALGRAIADALPDEGGPPRLVGFLPSSGRIVKSVRFVPNRALLDRYYFLADEDLLDLDHRAVEAILASLAPRGIGAGDPFRVLLASYPGQEAAEKAARRFFASYLPDADASGIARTEEGKWTGSRRMGARILAVVFDVPSREEAAAALGEIEQRVKGEVP